MVSKQTTSSGCSGAHSVDQADLELSDASAGIECAPPLASTFSHESDGLYHAALSKLGDVECVLKYSLKNLSIILALEDNNYL